MLRFEERARFSPCPEASGKDDDRLRETIAGVLSAATVTLEEVAVAAHPAHREDRASENDLLDSITRSGHFTKNQSRCRVMVGTDEFDAWTKSGARSSV